MSKLIFSEVDASLIGFELIVVVEEGIDDGQGRRAEGAAPLTDALMSLQWVWVVSPSRLWCEVTHNFRCCLTELHSVRNIITIGPIKKNRIPDLLHGCDGNLVLDGPWVVGGGNEVDVCGNVLAAPGIELFTAGRKGGIGEFAAVQMGILV